jgi:hypothetical protein
MKSLRVADQNEGIGIHAKAYKTRTHVQEFYDDKQHAQKTYTGYHAHHCHQARLRLAAPCRLLLLFCMCCESAHTLHDTRCFPAPVTAPVTGASIKCGLPSFRFMPGIGFALGDRCSMPAAADSLRAVALSTVVLQAAGKMRGNHVCRLVASQVISSADHTRKQRTCQRRTVTMSTAYPKDLQEPPQPRLLQANMSIL